MTATVTRSAREISNVERTTAMGQTLTELTTAASKKFDHAHAIKLIRRHESRSIRFPITVLLHLFSLNCTFFPMLKHLFIVWHRRKHENIVIWHYYVTGNLNYLSNLLIKS